MANSCVLLVLSGPVPLRTSDASFGASCFIAFVGMNLPRRGLAASWTSATFPFFMFSLDSLISAVFVVLEYGSSKVLEVDMKLFQ